MENFLTPLFSGAGVAGLILGFHLWKLAPELRAIWRALDRLNRVQLLRVQAQLARMCNDRDAIQECRDSVSGLLTEIDSEEDRAKKREIIPP